MIAISGYIMNTTFDDDLEIDVARKWRRDIKTSELVNRGICLLAQAGPALAAEYFLQVGIPISVAVRVLAGKPVRTPLP